MSPNQWMRVRGARNLDRPLLPPHRRRGHAWQSLPPRRIPTTDCLKALMLACIVGVALPLRLTPRSLSLLASPFGWSPAPCCIGAAPLSRLHFPRPSQNQWGIAVLFGWSPAPCCIEAAPLPRLHFLPPFPKSDRAFIPVTRQASRTPCRKSEPIGSTPPCRGGRPCCRGCLPARSRDTGRTLPGRGGRMSYTPRVWLGFTPSRPITAISSTFPSTETPSGSTLGSAASFRS
jgi:hypothetical protein